MLYKKTNCYELYHGKMEEELSSLEDNSVDSIVTDPPYELNFMNKGWDNAGVSFQKETWEKCLRVLKPGGHLLAFGGSRTFHRIACAIEDAGFEIRDTIMWVYGSGFPKSMSLGKVLEGKQVLGSGANRDIKKLDGKKIEYISSIGKFEVEQGYQKKNYIRTNTEVDYTTDLGKKWDGWGTCLKPSFEPIIIARKPPVGSLIDTVMQYGVGGINIDECRIPTEDYLYNHGNSNGTVDSFSVGNFGKAIKGENKSTELGRFPANTILTYDETDFDEVCGGFPITKSTGGSSTMPDFKDAGVKNSVNKVGYNDGETATRKESSYICPIDSGSASRYFYCAKASKKDRDEGLDSFEEKKVYGSDMNWYYGNNNGDNFGDRIANITRKNIHPTVKPTELMQYLVRLVTPKGGTVLDPFMGSGSTGKAVMFENRERNANYKFIGIEMTEDYLPICEARIKFGMTYSLDDLTNDIKPTETTHNKKELW